MHLLIRGIVTHTVSELSKEQQNILAKNAASSAILPKYNHEQLQTNTADLITNSTTTLKALPARRGAMIQNLKRSYKQYINDHFALKIAIPPEECDAECITLKEAIDFINNLNNDSLLNCTLIVGRVDAGVVYDERSFTLKASDNLEQDDLSIATWEDVSAYLHEKFATFKDQQTHKHRLGI